MILERFHQKYLPRGISKSGAMQQICIEMWCIFSGFCDIIFMLTFSGHIRSEINTRRRPRPFYQITIFFFISPQILLISTLINEYLKEKLTGHRKLYQSLNLLMLRLTGTAHSAEHFRDGQTFWQDFFLPKKKQLSTAPSPVVVFFTSSPPP